MLELIWEMHKDVLHAVTYQLKVFTMIASSVGI